MAGNDRLVNIKKLNDLCLCRPDGLVREIAPQFYRTRLSIYLKSHVELKCENFERKH
jgi:hypothetical protein